jgi:hypothetical protein
MKEERTKHSALPKINIEEIPLGLFVLFLFAIVSSVLLRFMDSDYPFGIFLVININLEITH